MFLQKPRIKNLRIKKCRKILLFLFIVLVIFLFYYFGFSRYFSIESVKINKRILQEFVKNNYSISVLVFMGIYIFLTSFTLPFAVFLTVLSGYFFGAFAGAFYSCISATIGSTIAFLSFRYIAAGFVKNKLKNRMERFDRFRQELKLYGYSYLLSIHFSGVVPLFMVNIFASLAGIDVWTFCWTTAVGTFPAFLVYAFAGKQFGKISSFMDIFTPKILLAFLFLAILVGMPVIFRKIKKRQEI